MAPYKWIVKKESAPEVCSSASNVPEDVAVFAGRWTDSLGNSIHVEVVKDASTVTLTKRAGAQPITLRLYFDSYEQCWRCGNGFMGEVVYDSNTDKGESLNFVSWVTKDGRVSSWFRAQTCIAAEIPERTPELPARAPSSKAPMKAPESAMVHQDMPKRAPVPEDCESEPEDLRPSRNTTNTRLSWYDVTEEDEKSGGMPSLPSGPKQSDKEKGLVSTEETKKRTRRGRRRGGRAMQS